MARCAGVLLGLSACGVVFIPDQVEDLGQVCLHPPGQEPPFGPWTFGPDDEIVATLTSGCFSSSCSRNWRTELMLDEVDGVFELSSITQWSTQVAPLACDDDCNSAVDAVMVGRLGEGAHTFRFGSASLVLAIPSEDTPCLPRD